MSQQTAVHTAQAAPNVFNGFDTDVLKGTVQAIAEAPELATCHFRVRNTWLGGGRNRSTVSDFYAAGQELSHKRTFVVEADEPPLMAGGDEAPNPVEHLLNALAGCVTSTIVAHATFRGIAIEEIECAIEGDLDLRGLLGEDGVPRGLTDVRVDYKIRTASGDLDELRELTAFSPVFNTLTEGTRVHIRIEPK